ncbi:phosphate/phosphite/phosphonate ABC transporter substrate-binding protein [Alteromonas lipolytica]|uniref:Phosphate ABC transporter substrate-binding protein n=1 Tax=Alteromonas lipolytica TaxID=1856405 RepID=A0A1E8FD29_9ALTE|nr:phosphate/phosphite/phosphonate ABC transporter substrate-binding protein [Alteromonas lipolytica]OFI33666.1 phosphate ABC transporter substrate-binding protein [Alteromonas lipolytica]GGF69487.1 phosphate ABC transporter substrate-binding protein [Alteromonas lipolytica]
MKFLFSILLALCVTPAIARLDNTSNPPRVYSFGVVPQQSAFKLAKMWTPLLQHLSEQTGISIQFVTAKDIPSFENELAAGNYDLSYMNPYHYVVFSDKAGYVPLVRDSKKGLKGIIVTRHDSPITSIQQLQGLALAFPAPAAFAASIIPRAEMNRAGISIVPRYVNSHDSVYLNVIKSLFPAGGGIIRSLEHLPEAQRSQLRILWQSKTYTSHAIAAHSRVPPAQRKQLVAFFAGLSQSEQGRSLLKQLNFSQLDAATDSDWDDIRELGIHSLSRPDY